MKISDLSCIGKNNKPIHGTAAMLHRIFGNANETAKTTKADDAAIMKQYIELIKRCKYASFD